MKFVSIWLLVVASLRVFSVVLGYLGPESFREQLFTVAPQEMTALAARTFGTWTALTCMCCVVTAFEPTSRGLHFLTLLSFVVAGAYFSLETFVYQTMVLSKYVLVAFGVASSSTLVLLFTFPSNNANTSLTPAEKQQLKEKQARARSSTKKVA